MNIWEGPIPWTEHKDIGKQQKKIGKHNPIYLPITGNGVWKDRFEIEITITQKLLEQKGKT